MCVAHVSTLNASALIRMRQSAAHTHTAPLLSGTPVAPQHSASRLPYHTEYAKVQHMHVIQDANRTGSIISAASTIDLLSKSPCPTQQEPPVQCVPNSSAQHAIRLKHFADWFACRDLSKLLLSSLLLMIYQRQGPYVPRCCLTVPLPSVHMWLPHRLCQSGGRRAVATTVAQHHRFYRHSLVPPSWQQQVNNTLWLPLSTQWLDRLLCDELSCIIEHTSEQIQLHVYSL